MLGKLGVSIPNSKEQGRVRCELVHEKGVNTLKIGSVSLVLRNLIKNDWRGGLRVKESNREREHRSWLSNANG